MFQKSWELTQEPSHTREHPLGSSLSTLWDGAGRAAADRKPRWTTTHFRADDVPHDCLHSWGRTTVKVHSLPQALSALSPSEEAVTVPIPQRDEENITEGLTRAKRFLEGLAESENVGPSQPTPLPAPTSDSSSMRSCSESTPVHSHRGLCVGYFRGGFLSLIWLCR